ncbi:uncharacterized protein LOC133920642 [Phragmites australis]|uniref:uncharacterized protein LOC133920642 n=1 Tax=Phragmites australis TaxID=29695 RepID=UPI002D794016|nr:uncharacterized protein LOC133920642 [Phragmites australis]
MAGKQQQQQQQGVAVAEPGAARRLWRVVRAVLYVLRRGLPSGRKLAMDLHLLLHRGKIAGKALGDLLAFHHHHGSHGRRGAAFSAAGDGGSSSFSCRALDPSLAVHEPSRRSREVEFSCSNTPSSDAGGGLHLLGAGKRRGRNRHHRDETNGYLHYYNYDAADVARVFEMLNDDGYRLFNDDEPPATTATYYTTPSPAQLLWAFARSPAVTSRQLRITDSPFQAAAAARDADGAQVDRQADEFIRRFYEQLRAQKSAASTPDYYGHATPSSYASGRAPRPVAAGIA